MLGEHLHEPDIDRLNGLPMPVLLGWQEHLSKQVAKDPPGLSPAAAFALFKKQYGGQNG